MLKKEDKELKPDCFLKIEMTNDEIHLSMHGGSNLLAQMIASCIKEEEELKEVLDHAMLLVMIKKAMV